MASAADLIPSVEAYLEANGLSKTLSAMKAEAKAKNMTPSKKVVMITRRVPTKARASHTHTHTLVKDHCNFQFSFPNLQLFFFFFWFFFSIDRAKEVRRRVSQRKARADAIPDMSNPFPLARLHPSG